MACGVTNNGVVCDNAGTSSHAGMHSGVKSQFWNLFTVRVYWGNSNDSTPAAFKTLAPGVLAHSSTGFINEVATPGVTAAGLTKSGTHVLPDNAWQTIPGWSIRAGFPDTVKSGEGILIAGSGNIRVKGNMNLSAVNRYGERGCRVVKNSTIITTATIGGISSSTTALDHPITTPTFSVVAGDIIYLQGWQSNSNTTYRTVTSNTWFEVEVM